MDAPEGGARRLRKPLRRVSNRVIEPLASLAVGEICPPEPCIGLKTSSIGSKAVGMGAVTAGMEPVTVRMGSVTVGTGSVPVRIMLDPAGITPDPAGIMPDSVGNHDSYSLHRARHSLH